MTVADLNLLFGQTPNVSSTYTRFSLVASKITDGIKGRNGDRRNYWHSASVGNDEWAEVPLAHTAVIRTVTLWNRPSDDDFHERIDGAVIFGRDSNGSLHSCGEPLFTTGWGESITRFCSSTIAFESIRVELNEGVPLQIGELEAYDFGTL